MDTKSVFRQFTQETDFEKHAGTTYISSKWTLKLLTTQVSFESKNAKVPLAG